MKTRRKRSYQRRKPLGVEDLNAAQTATIGCIKSYQRRKPLGVEDQGKVSPSSVGSASAVLSATEAARR